MAIGMIECLPMPSWYLIPTISEGFRHELLWVTTRKTDQGDTKLSCPRPITWIGLSHMKPVMSLAFYTSTSAPTEISSFISIVGTCRVTNRHWLRPRPRDTLMNSSASSLVLL
jgi:hypothetical protein